MKILCLMLELSRSIYRRSYWLEFGSAVRLVNGVTGQTDVKKRKWKTEAVPFSERACGLFRLVGLIGEARVKMQDLIIFIIFFGSKTKIPFFLLIVHFWFTLSVSYRRVQATKKSRGRDGCLLIDLLQTDVVCEKFQRWVWSGQGNAFYLIHPGCLTQPDSTQTRPDLTLSDQPDLIRSAPAGPAVKKLRLKMTKTTYGIPTGCRERG